MVPSKGGPVTQGGWETVPGHLLVGGGCGAVTLWVRGKLNRGYPPPNLELKQLQMNTKRPTKLLGFVGEEAVDVGLGAFGPTDLLQHPF